MSLMRHFTAVLALAAAVTIASPSVRASETAADYPSRPVRIIVPFGAGGPTDVFTRAIAEELRKSLKQTFIMENKPGAGTTIGTDYVAKAAPDGYTLLMVSGTQTVNETLFSHKPYRLMHDLVPVAPLIDTDLVLVVHPSVPAKNVAELLALARAKPGTLNFGSSGIGSTNHLAGELLKRMTGIDIVHVPYKGAAPAMNDLIAGHIPMMFDNMPAVLPQVQGGSVRAIAVAGAKRAAALPDVPTVAESGVPGFEAFSWFGMVAPAQTPRDVLETLQGDVAAILKMPDVQKRLAELGADPGTVTGAAFGTFLAEDTAKWTEIIKASGATAE